MAVVVNTRSPSDSRYTLKLNINPRSPDITNNRTVVDWSLVLSFSDTLAYGRYWSGSDISYSVALNGSTVKSGKYTYDFRKYSTLTIASGSTTINHNSDGSKTLSASCSAQMYTPQVVRETISGSGSLTLPTIPRASQPRLSASSVAYGNAVTIYTDRKSSDFTHRIRAEWNGKIDTIATDVETSYAWTVPLSYLNRIPNAKSTTGTIYLDTYNGSTLIGTKTVRLTTNAPSNIGPSVDTIILEEAVSGIANQFGAYIQGKSQVKATVQSSAKYGSTVKSVQIQLNGESVTRGAYQTKDTSSFTCGYLKSSGSQTVVVRVTDSRGLSSSKSASFPVLAYTAPRITSFNAFRSDASGAVNQTGVYAVAQYKASITPLGDKNTKSYKIRYRPVGATSWTEIALSSDSYNPSSQRVLPNVSTESSYEIELIVSDYFSTASTMVKISTAFVKVRFGPGNQIGIGKVPEKDGVEIDLPSWFHSPIEVLEPESALNPATKEYVDGGIKHPIVIPNGADLNEYQTPGLYRQSQSAQTSEMKNIPHKTAFSLCVYENNGVTQVFTTYDSYFRIYVRAIYDGNWSPWKCVYDHNYNNVTMQKGSNSNGTWVKYFDGRMEQWGTTTVNVPGINKSWGNMYYADPLPTLDFPLTFASKPTVTLGLERASGHDAWLGTYVVDTNGIREINLYRPTVSGSCEFNMNWHAIGYY